MSRSNGPIGQSGGAQPPYKRTIAEQDAANRAAYPLGQGGHGQGAAPSQQLRHSPAAFGSIDPTAANGYGANGHDNGRGYPVNGQGYDQHAAHAPSAYPNQPAYPQQPGFYPANAAPAGQPSYQPVFDRYAPEPQTRAPEPVSRGYDIRAQQPRTAAPQAQSYAPPAQPAPFDPQDPYQWQPQPGQQPAPAQRPFTPQAHAPANPAPHGYDFSNYAPAPQHDVNGQAYGQPTNQQPHGRDPRQQHGQVPPGDDTQWQLAGASDRRGEPAADHHAYADPHDLGVEPGYGGEANGQLQHADDLAYDQDDLPDYEDDEPRKGRRGLIMVSALVGAIALGGSMAYAYKTFIKPSTGGQVAKVSAPKGPAKTAPADPGGKQFANQESKLQERLGDGTAAPAGATPSLGETDGVQRVKTVSVGRDGTMSAPAQASAIPGMVVQMPAQPQAVPSTLPPAPATQARILPQQQAPQPTPRVIASAEPAADVAPPEPQAPAAKKAAPQKKPLAARDDLVASNGVPSAAIAAPPAPTKAGGTGFVAVIASKASKADAQKANVDLEQRFDVLKGKIFDVQEADLTAQGKGVVYRSVVGPPGSRAFASGICDQLKTVGYTDCWPVKYN